MASVCFLRRFATEFKVLAFRLAGLLRTPALIPLTSRTALANNLHDSHVVFMRSSGARTPEKWRTLRPMIKQLSSVILTCAVLVLGGCESVRTTSAGAVGVDRKQQMLVPSETIEQGAAQAYEAELKAARDKGVLNTDRAQLDRVTTISRRLVAATPTFRADAPSWKWQFNVQKTKELNAYCMPGGRIMVYSGLIETLDLNDAELATVLAHEVAHALREHTRERVSRAYAQQLVLSGAAAVAGVSETTANVANMVAEVTFQLPFGRDQESE